MWALSERQKAHEVDRTVALVSLPRARHARAKEGTVVYSRQSWLRQPPRRPRSGGDGGGGGHGIQGPRDMAAAGRVQARLRGWVARQVRRKPIGGLQPSGLCCPLSVPIQTHAHIERVHGVSEGQGRH